MKFAVDLSPLVKQFDINGNQIVQLVDTLVKGVSYDIYSRIQKKASNELKTSRLEYLKGLKYVDPGLFSSRISLEGFLATSLEEGVSSYDMKQGLLNGPNSKLGKNGRYNTVPFRFSTPSAKFGFENIPSDVFKIVKSKKQQKVTSTFSKSSPITAADLIKVVQKRSMGGSGVKSINTTAKRSLSKFQGLVRSVDSSGKGTYSTFRRVSEKSPKGSWIHPGLKAKNYFGQVVDNYDPTKTAGKIIDQFLIDQGF